ncbi:uncharacterized protein [Cherax quadricarinatus]|uniref:uncharacterized protein n=1 Tax=Cherax quadricarinatus TaxID=27406 RepID=UPI00387E9368
MAVITKEENNGFRIMKALSECGRGVLHHTFCWGTPDKPDNTKLNVYLKNLKQPSSANYLKLNSKERRFNKIENRLINSSADGREFDVPLLCRSIKLACENVAPLSDPIWITKSKEMEYYITAINNMRNHAVHGPLAVTDEDYYENMKKLRELLTGCLKTSGERYVRDQDEVNKEIQQMNDKLDDIMNEILGEEDIMKYCSDDIKQDIINDSCDKLKEFLEEITYINPVSFIKDNFKLKVNKVFVDIEVKQGRHRDNNKHIDYVDLLSLVQTTSVASSVSSGTQQQGSCARPQILLLEGVAGSGKTTLVKLITEEWIQGGQGKIKDLDNYDLLLWVQCRDPTIISYHDLLHRLLPDASAKFRNILPKIIKLCKVIILVDGLDELNNNSRTLVKSLLLEFQNSVNTTFICTTRPEVVEMFRLTIPEGYGVTNAELRGINKDRLEEFVRQIHQEIINLTKSNRNTDELVNNVMRVEDLHEHLRLPMNLTFLVYIWDQEPDELNIRTITQTELYNKIHEMCQNRLLERLVNCSKTKMMNSVQEILKIIYATSLESLSRDQLSLEEETVDQLISACNKHDIPYHEMMSAFFSLKPICTWKGIQECYSAPHKGIQDYFSALHIVMTLKHQLQSSPIPVMKTPSVSSQPLASRTPASPVSIRGVLKESIKSSKVDMNKYHNVLIHVAGLLHLVLEQVPEALVREVVNLLQESGMTDNDQWLDLLENTKFSSVTVKEISRFFETKQTINVTSGRVRSYSALLQHLSSREVVLNIHGNPGDLLDLPDLLSVLNHHHCAQVTLYNHYQHAETNTTSDKILQLLQSRSHLEEFWGCLTREGVKLLRECPQLTDLYLAVVSDNHARSLLPQLHQTVTSTLHQLRLLKVRVSAAAVSAAALTSLPSTLWMVDIELTDVIDAKISHACDVIQELQPPEGYGVIWCVSSTASVAGIQDLVRGLRHRRVKVNHKLQVSTSVTITQRQEDQLVNQAKTTLNCHLDIDSKKMKADNEQSTINNQQSTISNQHFLKERCTVS